MLELVFLYCKHHNIATILMVVFLVSTIITYILYKKEAKTDKTSKKTKAYSYSLLTSILCLLCVFLIGFLPNAWGNYARIIIWSILLISYGKRLYDSFKSEDENQKMNSFSAILLVLMSLFIIYMSYTDIVGQTKDERSFDLCYNIEQNEGYEVSAFEITGFFWDKGYVTTVNSQDSLIFEKNGEVVASTADGCFEEGIHIFTQGFSGEFTPKDHVRFKISNPIYTDEDGYRGEIKITKR